MPPPLSWTDQVTAVDWPEVVPVTVAVKVSVPRISVEAVRGETVTAMFGLTVTVAVSFLVGSATLVATTWKVPAVPGAV